RVAQTVVTRHSRLGPVVLIPSAPDDPFTGPGVGHATADASDDVFEAAWPSQVDILQGGPDPHHVSMGILKTGNDRRTTDVDHARRRSLEPKDLRFPADAHDS